MYKRCFVLLARGGGVGSTLTAQPKYVDLPESVKGDCKVYPNFVSEKVAMTVWEQLYRPLEKCGEDIYTSAEKEAVKLRHLEMYGLEADHTKVTTQQGTQKQMVGIPNAPTLLELCQKEFPKALGYTPDQVLATEHLMPGYDMQTQASMKGSRWGYLNFMADTVLFFDNEQEGLEGQVFLPARSMMVVEGGLRWNWRFGEKHKGPFFFGRKTIEPEYRFSLMLWRFSEGLVDVHSVNEVMQKQSENFLQDEKTPSVAGEKYSHDTKEYLKNPQKALEQKMVRDAGQGTLGGDYVQETDQLEKGGDIRDPKTQIPGTASIEAKFGEAEQILQAGGPDAENKVGTLFGFDDGPDKYGFDGAKIEDSFDNTISLAMRQRSKLKAMLYDEQIQSREKQGDIRDVVKTIGPNEREMDKKRDLKSQIGKIHKYAGDMGIDLGGQGPEQTEAEFKQMVAQEKEQAKQNVSAGDWRPDLTPSQLEAEGEVPSAIADMAEFVTDMPGCGIEIEVPPNGW